MIRHDYTDPRFATHQPTTNTEFENHLAWQKNVGTSAVKEIWKRHHWQRLMLMILAPLALSLAPLSPASR